MTNETITIDQFIAKHELLFSCKRVEKRADGLGEGMTRHFRCSISNPGVGSFGLYFSQGSAHTQDPTLADVLDCLASDASGYENAVNGAFEWASECGYDEDSRKAEKIFRAIKRQAEQLKRTLGQEAYEELLWNTERL
jgi:hypothetical protein